MDDSVEAVDGEIVPKLKRFLLEEGENEIIVIGPQNFIYAFSKTIDKEMVKTWKNKLLTLDQDICRSHQQLGMIYYLTVMAKFVFSMLYLILTLMLGMEHEEPWLLLWLQETYQVFVPRIYWYVRGYGWNIDCRNYPTVQHDI